MAEYIERCVDCIHYAACKNWAKIALGGDTMFPYEGEREHEHICPDFKPAADVQEVQHGRWMPQVLCGERIYDCSECKTIGSPAWKWCPLCGTMMDGKGDA